MNTDTETTGRRDFEGRTVFITGGAQGIGLGMARAFVRAGARVAVADLAQEHLDGAVEELRELAGDSGSAAGFVLDVRDRAGYPAVVNAAEDVLGPISVLCNNAGLGTMTPFTELDYADWDLVLGVNLGGVVNGIRSVLPRLLERGGPAHIVNTASGAGLSAVSAELTYCTSKFAVVGLSESLRLRPELVAAGIGVTVLCPGMVRTDVLLNTAKVTGGAEPVVQSGHQLLQRYGLDADVVGEQVISAVRGNEPYVLTDRYIEPLLEKRSRALAAALPPRTERDGELAALLQQRLAASAA